MVPLTMRSPCCACLTTRLVFVASSGARKLLRLGSRCCTISTGGVSAENAGNTCRIAGNPPAEAPIAITSTLQRGRGEGPCGLGLRAALATEHHRLPFDGLIVRFRKSHADK